MIFLHTTNISLRMKTAVLFLIFNRSDTAEQVFEAIRKAHPPRLYVAADGPRKDRPGEAEKCARTRAIIDRVDWPCEVHRLSVHRRKSQNCPIAHYPLVFFQYTGTESQTHFSHEVQCTAGYPYLQR